MTVNPAFDGAWKSLPASTPVWTIRRYPLDSDLICECDTAWTDPVETESHFWVANPGGICTGLEGLPDPVILVATTLGAFLASRERGHHMNPFESLAISRNIAEYESRRGRVTP